MTYVCEGPARAFCGPKGYTFDRPVGEGAFKETFRVTTTPGSALALKVYRPGYSPERTTREVDAMVRCDHPNICKLIELTTFDHGGTAYTVSVEEYLAGGTLAQRMSGAVLSAPDTTNLGGLLMDAVGHIAGHRLVHRDLKPDNIMFRDGGMSPVIVDFGLVRDLSKLSITVTWAGQGPGTPLYAPPEQLLNEKAMIDWRADQFALGVVLSFAAFGVHPYTQPGDDDAATVSRVAGRNGPSTSFVTSARVAGLDALTRMVAPYPIQRFRTPQLLAAAWPRGI